LISIIVTLLASVVNFVVDYLFIDILSAPTADSFKVDSPNITPKAQLSSPGTTPSHPLEIAKRASLKGSLLSETQTRIVSTSLVDAHSNAVETFRGAMGDTQSQVEQSCQKLMSQRVTRLTRIKSIKGGGAIPSKISSTTPPKLFQLDGVDVNDLFSTLKEEIVEERGLIRRQYEKAAFDALWGSVIWPPPSLFLLISLLLGSIAMENFSPVQCKLEHCVGQGLTMSVR
jgi:hypothetical protein